MSVFRFADHLKAAERIAQANTTQSAGFSATHLLDRAHHMLAVHLADVLGAFPADWPGASEARAALLRGVDGVPRPFIAGPARELAAEISAVPDESAVAPMPWRRP